MIAYRQAIKNDASVLSEILAATLGSSHPISTCSDKVTSGWIAQNEGRPIGIALADREKGELTLVAVIPEFTGQGIGRNLMRQADAWLFSHGWDQIRLSIPSYTGETARGFFLHLGWNCERAESSGRHFKKANPQQLISLEEHIIEDESTGYTRIVRLQRAPTEEPHRLCLFLDGEHYWRDMYAIPLLNDLMEKGVLPPMTLALVGHVSAASRQEDYVCNNDYAQFIGDAVMPWLENEIPSLQEGRHLICGLSLSGLMASYLTLQYPQHFDACLSQSGSHWWEHEWFAEMARKKAPVNSRFWLSVGDEETKTPVKHSPTLTQEIPQISGVIKAAKLLEKTGATVHFNQYQGGHSLQCWHEELGNALAWLSSPATNTDLQELQ